MRIIIDIAHPAHVNFFKHSASKLRERGHEVTILCLERNKLPLILEKEYPGFKIVIIGKHSGTKLSVIKDANLKRFIRLFKFLSKNKFDLGLSVGGFNLGFILKLFDIPNIQFDDDPERGLNTVLEKLSATELYYPPIVENSGNVYSFKALKEWSYLSPKYFSPNIEILKDYGLEPKNYIFVREISTGSLNYSKQKPNIISTFARKIKKSWKIILSLENRKKLGYYPDDWILLREPIKDIHSLIYYSKLVISSGDSMAREGSLLGVPSIYCGNRQMKANKLMIKKKMLFHYQPDDILDKMNELLEESASYPAQDLFREKLKEEWVDVTEFIISTVEKFNNKK